MPRRLEEEFEEPSRPVHLVALRALFVVFFAIYDAVVFLPLKLFADPAEKRELSDRVKARAIQNKDGSVDYRHVDHIDRDLLSNVYPNCKTLGDLWALNVRSYSDRRCMGTRQLEKFEETEKDGKTLQQLTLGEYEFETYKQVDDSVQGVIRGLKSYNLKKGDNVVIFAETRAEWMQTALACFTSGYPVTTVYATLGDEGVEYALKDCEAKVVFTSRSLLSKVHRALDTCPSIEHVVYFKEQHRSASDSGLALMSQVLSFQGVNRTLDSFETLQQMDGGGNTTQEKIEPDDLAMIMYTSGTTGNPKGVMISHRNIIAAISGQGAVLRVDEDDTYIGYLPLAHILEVCCELVVLGKGTCIGYSTAQTLFDRAPKIKKGTQGDCAALKPTLIACVPAVLDRIFKAVSEEVKSKSPLFREIFRICYERRRSRHQEGYVSLVMNKLAFNRISKLLGGSLRYVLSGGAPLNPETQRFMNICFCCPVVQGYGLTETCGGASLADEYDLSTGSVGPPLRCCQLKLRKWSEAGYSPQNETPQGEVLIGGDNVALGYYKMPEKTAEDFLEIDGMRYFASGDIGEFREDGALRIIDRKKDLIKMAHGEYISLSKVETALLTNEYIDNICVYGDSDHDYLLGIAVPNQKNFTRLANEKGVTGSWEQICKNKKSAKALVEELKNFSGKSLQKAEVPQKLVLEPEPWTPAGGLLTEALKLKRRNITDHYKDQMKEAFDSK